MGAAVLAAAAWYIFFKPIGPVELPAQMGNLRVEKEASEQAARQVKELHRQRVFSDVDLQLGQNLYEGARAKFSGCVQELDSMLVYGAPNEQTWAMFLKRAGEAREASDQFRRWFFERLRGGGQSGAQQAANVPQPGDFVSFFKGMAEWAVKMRQEVQQGKIDEIRRQLSTLYWVPFDSV
jgi:hypothetical protein